MKMSRQSRSIPVSVSMTWRQWALIDRLSIDARVSRSEILRDAVRVYAASVASITPAMAGAPIGVSDFFGEG